MVKLKIVPKEHDQKTTRMQNNKDFIRFRSLYSEGKSFVIWTCVNNGSKPQSFCNVLLGSEHEWLQLGNYHLESVIVITVPLLTQC